MKNYKYMIKLLLVYLIFTIVLTVAYNYLPIIIHFSLFGQDSFYSGIITNMYSSIIDFVLLTIIFTVLLDKNRKKDIIREYKENIDDCRFWDGREAGFKIAGNIKRLQEHKVYDLDLSKCFMVSVILKKVTLSNSKLMGAVLCESNFEGAIMQGCNLQGAYLTKSIMRKVDFSNSNLRHIKCNGAKLNSIKANNCNFEYADFTDADLRYSIIKNANMNKVNFTNCNLERANLLGARNLDVNELIKCKSLKYIKLDKDMLEKVKKLKPELM